MTGLNDEVAKLHVEAQRADALQKEWRQQAADRRREILDLQREAAERLKALEVGSRLIVLRPSSWLDNHDFGRHRSGWRRTRTQLRCWVLADRTEYGLTDSLDPVAELLLEDGQVVSISEAIYVPTTLSDVFAVSQMPDVMDHWPGRPYFYDPTVGKARELLAKLIVNYERRQASTS